MEAHLSIAAQWDVAIGPLDEARFFQVPDAGLHEFLRTLASQGVSEFEISSGGWVFRIRRLAVPLCPPGPDTEPAGKPTAAGQPDHRAASTPR